MPKEFRIHGKQAAPGSGITVPWRHSLRTRITLWTGAITMALLLLALLIAAGFARDLVLEETKRNIREETREAAQRIGNALRMVAVTCNGIADTIDNTRLAPDQLVSMVRAMIDATPGATGAMLALEPTLPGERLFAYYVSETGRDRDFIATGYDYASQDWYRRTLASSDGWWSEPYLNETAGGIWAITYNQPLRSGTDDGRPRGMVSMDFTLDGMRALAGVHAAQPGWQVAVVAPEGLIAIHPEPGIALTHTLNDYIERAGRDDLGPLTGPIGRRETFSYSHTDPRDGTRYFTAVEPNGVSGGSVIMSVSYASILGRLYQVLAMVIAAGALAALLSLLALHRLAYRISRPVEDLTVSAVHLDNGEYERPVPHTGRDDEVGYLARTLDDARTSIQRQLVEIETMSAARQKLASELSIAREIQRSMVPPPRRIVHPAGLVLDVHAAIEPAKEVGGDFYGYHVDEDVFWFGIGDVSDKGIPAALFMARSDAILKTASWGAASPRDVLATASQLLAEGNDACMFITTLIGCIDLRNGDCMLASAGHEAPLLLRADGRAERLEFGSGPPLGFEVHEDFPLWRGRLGPGDSLIAWTDGVTEAFDADDEAFGDDRLQAALRADRAADENCGHLLAAVHAFAAGAPQSDDITILAIRRNADATDNGDAPC
ncbi:SpoIIE family protein phosphatase [Coralloluteibacterium thermophilus]|uniref:SpoIIE family protein phosphatase n=1 Tax=Coralloluteibacterium thermophilum TaxID=2707049 RepID=A0ABV9NT44_9GAMM